MKVSKDDFKNFSGFQEVSPGWHLFRVGEPVFSQDETNQATSTLRVPLVVAEGSEEDGAQISVFCPLDKKVGRRKYALILAVTGVAEMLEKKMKLNQDLSVDEWGEKYLNIQDERCMKVINMSIALLPGRTLKGEVEVRHTKDRDYRNITKVDYAEGGAEEEGTEEITEEAW